MSWDELPPTESELKGPESWDSAPPSEAELKFHQPWDLVQDVDHAEPGLQDATVPDAMTIQGLSGLAKTGVSLAAKSPMMENLIPSIQRVADDELLKSTGYTAGQIRQLSQTEGPEIARKAADYGRELGLGDVFSSQIGREKLLKNATEETGKQIGNLRETAGNAPLSTEAEVKAYLANKYGQGGIMGGKENGAEQALEDIHRIGNKGPQTVDQYGNPIPAEGPREAPTIANYSKASTFLNKATTQPGGLKYPSNVVTDAARKLSQVNDANAVQSLGPEKGAEYLQTLEDARNQHILGPFLVRGEAREMAHRGGIGGLIEDTAKKMMDMGGHRGMSKALNSVAEGLSNTPGMAANASNLAKSSPAWSDTLSDYLRQKYENLKQ